jgi:hypothetical protein
MIHDAAELSGRHCNCFAREATAYGIGPELAPRALELFGEALELAKDPVVTARIEKASIAAYRLAIEPVWYEGDPSKVAEGVLQRMRPLLKRFLELCEKYRVDRAWEHQGFEVDRSRLETLLKAAGEG